MPSSSLGGIFFARIFFLLAGGLLYESAGTRLSGI
jgi:hypothetical protein